MQAAARLQGDHAATDGGEPRDHRLGIAFALVFGG
jgi:hypothetical protein